MVVVVVLPGPTVVLVRDVEVDVEPPGVVVVVVVEPPGQVQSALQARKAPAADPGQVRDPGGSHASPGSTWLLPQTAGVVVVVVVATVVVVVTGGAPGHVPSPSHATNAPPA